MEIEEWDDKKRYKILYIINWTKRGLHAAKSGGNINIVKEAEKLTLKDGKTSFSFCIFYFFLIVYYSIVFKIFYYLSGILK